MERSSGDLIVRDKVSRRDCPLGRPFDPDCQGEARTGFPSAYFAHMRVRDSDLGGEFAGAQAAMRQPFRKLHGSDYRPDLNFVQSENFGLPIWSRDEPTLKMPRMKKRRAALPLGRTYLREWRKERHLTIEQLAERAGLSIATVSDIENQKVAYTQKSLEPLAKALEVPPGFLLSRHPSAALDTWAIAEQIGQMTQERREQLSDLLKILGRWQGPPRDDQKFPDSI